MRTILFILLLPMFASSQTINIEPKTLGNLTANKLEIRLVNYPLDGSSPLVYYAFHNTQYGVISEGNLSLAAGTIGSTSNSGMNNMITIRAGQTVTNKKVRINSVYSPQYVFSYVSGGVENILRVKKTDADIAITKVEYDTIAARVLRSLGAVKSSYIEGSANNIAGNKPTKPVGSEVVFGSRAAVFSPTDSNSLLISSNPTMQGGETDLFFSAWVKGNAFSTPMAILGKDDNASALGSEYFLYYYPAYGTFGFQIEEGTGGTTKYVLSPIGTPEVGRWYWVCAWYDHIAGTVNIQIDGGAVTTVTGVATQSNVTDSKFAIGSAYGEVSPYFEGSFWNGSIKCVGFWKRVLTQAERNSLREFTAPINANLIGGYSRSADVPAVYSSNVNSTVFNGANAYASFPPSSLPAMGSTLSLWFKPAAFGGYLFGNLSDPDTYIKLQSSTVIRVQTDASGSFKDFAVPTMSTGTWYNLIITRDGSSLTHVFLNGTESSSGGQSQTDNITITQIGKYWDGTSGGWYSGKISNVRLFGTVLSSGDIANIQSGSATTAVATLFYKFNEASGATVIDYGTGSGIAPKEYANIPQSLRDEPRESFVSWWDLKEVNGVRLDSRGTQ